jgi:hypothetical protein
MRAMENATSDESNPDFQMQDGEDGPDMFRLARAYRKVVEDLNPRIQQDQYNYDTRHCVWPGQSEDQRKHSVKTGDTQPFPWDGASDLKVHVVDEIINHGVAIDVMALAKANVRAVAVEGGDLGKAAIVSNFMRWLVLSQMTELPDEAEVLANYRREKGLGILGVFWDSRVQKTQQKISLAEIADTAPDVATAIQNGLFPDEIATLLRQFFPEISKKKARAMVKDLQNKGETTVPFTVQQVNRPMVRAYAVGEDIFLPPNTTDLQSARGIYRKVMLSAEQAREKTVSEGWDKEYVEEAIEYCMGAPGIPEAYNITGNDQKWSEDRVGLTGFDINAGLIEFVYAYERLSDEDGVPGIFCTVFCPSCHEEMSDGEEMGYAKHELLGYRHGLYPFVEFPLEKLSRLLLDTRGQPEVLRGNQDAIKTEVDSRRDNASLSTCPPVTHPVGREPGRIGPGAMVSERRPGEYGYMEVPPPPQASVEIQANIEARTRRQAGRPTADDETGEYVVKQQKDIQTWLKKWSLVMQQIWELYSQYGPDEEKFRVIGAQTPEAQMMVKAELSGKYDFYLSYDVLSNDPDNFQAKLKAMGEIAQQFDRNGQVDYSKLLQRAFEMIDPVMAEDVLIPSQVAAQKEVTETQGDISRMWAGVDLDAPQQGLNPELRLQVIKNWMTGVPDNPAVDVQARMVADESLRVRIERYVQQLQFQMDQRQNAQIGRIGTAPAGSTGQ